MNIRTPPSWRKGQTIFNFLEWLRTEKGYKPNQSTRMADPFHILDKDLDALYEEFLNQTDLER
jgi:hypothetical protein